jgi:hypothetical protein
MFDAVTNISSYALNGWLYQNQGANDTDTAAYWAQTQTSVGAAGLFGKLDNVKHPSQTPFFSDAPWPDGWPNGGTQGQPGDSMPTWNLYTGLGNPMSAGLMMGRFCIARHGLKDPAQAPAAIADSVPRLPGAVNVGCVDGHVDYAPLDNLWSAYYWHMLSVPQPRPL